MRHQIRVLVVDDLEMVRLGIKLAFQDNAIVEIVGLAADGQSALDLALDLKPNVVLLDIGLPDIDGIEVARRIKLIDPLIHLIMFTSHGDDESIFAALAAGADGYCAKEASSAEIATAIETVVQGAIWLPPAIANRIFRNCTSDGTQRRTAKKTNLLEREMAILSLVVQGKSGHEIAQELNLELGTVLSEMHAVVNKLAGSERAKSALQALRRDNGQQSGGLCTTNSLIGKVFADRYTILQEVGVGGMSTVYKAKHNFMNNNVAIKILSAHLLPDLKSVKRFRQEAQVTSSLSHPNIVAAHDFGITQDGQVFLIMDFLEGQSLSWVINQHKYLTVERSLSIFVQLCDALDYAHSKKIIHRDLKPANIIVTGFEDGGDGVKIVDFGIAKMIGPERDAGLTKQGEVFGSPVYMSPEQCMDIPIDERSDIYSLGCLMFEALSGRPPFRGINSAETIRLHVVEAPPLVGQVAPQNIPADLERLINSCLQKNTEDRPSAAQLKTALLRSLASV